MRIALLNSDDTLTVPGCPNSRQEDEAATADGIAMRMEKAGDFFMVREESGQVIGFINGTLSTSEALTHDSMSKHEPDVSPRFVIVCRRKISTPDLGSVLGRLPVLKGSTLCVHSVVTREDRRRQGQVGTRPALDLAVGTCRFQHSVFTRSFLP